MKFLLACLLPLSVFANLTDYLSLFDRHSTVLGPVGQPQEIEILLDEDAILEAELAVEARLISQGTLPEIAKDWSHVGIVSEDQYFYWIRDAVRFPSGSLGTYDRILWKSSLESSPGVGVLAVFQDKKIIVNLCYRHATRSWEIELPRGMRKQGESQEDAARREIQEETGAKIGEPLYLGEMSPDAGILSSTVPLFFAEVSHLEATSHDFSEVIGDNLTFTLEELKALYQKGTLSIPCQGKLITAHVRDAFLAYALFQAEIRGYLQTP